MDLQNLYLPVLFSAFLCFLIVLRKLKKTDSIPKLPPGPWKLPIIGNIHNLIGSLPHHRLTDLAKKYGPLMHLQLGEVSTIVVSSPEYAKEVMKTHDIIFSSRPRILASDILTYNSSGIAFAPYGNYWRQLRKICMSELLSHKRVQSFRPIREEVFSDLVKCVDSSEGIPVNLTKQVMSTISIITSRAAFGKECKDRQKFVAVVKEATEVAGGFNLGDLYPSVSWLQYVDGQRTKLEEVHRLTDRIMQNIIDEHKVARSRDEEGESEVEEDIVDVLLKLQESGNPEIRLTNDNIKAVILDMFGGGTETSSTTIIWAMAEMTKNPRAMKKAQAEIREVFDQKGKADETGIDELKYLKLVVKETLRLHPPGPLLLPRECGEACEINGYHIPFKSKVIVNAWAIGRDPNYWTEPERFYPERFADSSIDYKGTNFEFIPFGAGRRICPGINFGMMNVELPLALLLYHFDWKLPDGMKNENLDMTEAFGSAVMRKEDLYLIPSIHNALLVT